MPPYTELPLLSVRNLRVAFGEQVVVRGVDLTVHRGERLALVGESGSGKSVTARSLLGLAGDGATVTADALQLDGMDLRTLTEPQWRAVRGRRIGLVLQDALTSLDPLRPVGAEVAEVLHNHDLHPAAERPRHVLEAMAGAGVPDPAWRARQYSHELSGGLRQRALIASAVAGRPELLVADEPTTALDAIVRGRILELLADQVHDGTGLILISHDLAAVARVADRVAVMYCGEIVEQGPAGQVLAEPEHQYTRRLLDAVPRPGAVRGDTGPPPPIVLSGHGLRKEFATRGRGRHQAVDDVSFELRAGRTLGIIGESGSGKSTVANMVMGLLPPDEGTVRLGGEDWSDLPERERRRRRDRIQLVAQDPWGSFDPRWTVEQIVGEALGAVRRRAVAGVRDEVAHRLGLVGLDGTMLTRRPRELSGGQRQRVAIARALARDPDVLVCDEPVSALDVSVQAQVLDVFLQIRQRFGVALLFISHDLAVVRSIADDVLIMKEGRTVESGPCARVFEAPEHAYTRELLAAVPEIRPAPDRPEESRT